MGKLKEILENHPLIIITGIAASMLGMGWAASENIRVNPIQNDLERKTEEVEEYEVKIKQYESKIKLDNLVVYDSDAWHTEGEIFDVLGGQVSIKFVSASDLEDAKFIVEIVGEKDLQEIKAEPGKRAIFRYNGKLYLINIKEFADLISENQIKVSISEVVHDLRAVEKPKK